MKKLTIKVLFLLVFIVCFSCKKESANYCINRITGNPVESQLSETDLNLVKSLFDKNNISYYNYSFYWLETDVYGHHNISCFQYINNLKILSNPLHYTFDENDKFTGLMGEKIENINLDSIPNMNTNNVIEIFLDQISKSPYYKSNLAEIKNGCFDVEFGYFQDNPLDDPTKKVMVKAWKVKPHNSYPPYAYIDDSDGRVIIYWDGIGL